MRRSLFALTYFGRLARVENSVLPVFAILAGAATQATLTHFTTALACTIFVLAHSVVTVWNDMCDEQSDTHNNIHRIAAIRHAGAYKSLRVITVLLGTASIGLSTLLLTPQQTALFITYYVISWLYNSRPYQASHRPVASIVLLGMAYGLIPFLLGNGLTGITWALLLLGISWAIVRASLSILKDYKDAPGDAKSNKRTFLLSFGNRLTVRISLVLALIGYIGCIVGVSIYTTHTLLATSSLAILAFWLMYQRVKLLKVTQYAEANRLFHSFLEYELLFSCLAVIWLHQ